MLAAQEAKLPPHARSTSGGWRRDAGQSTRQRRGSDSPVRRWARVPGRERAAGGDATLQGVVLAVRACSDGGIDDQRTCSPAARAAAQAAAVGVTEQVVEVVVDVLRLPFAVDRPRQPGELLVVAVDRRDPVTDALTKRSHELVGQGRSHGTELRLDVVIVAARGRGHRARHRPSRRPGARRRWRRSSAGRGRRRWATRSSPDRTAALPRRRSSTSFCSSARTRLSLRPTGDDQRCQRLVAALERTRPGHPRRVGVSVVVAVRLRRPPASSPSAGGRRGRRRRTR